MKKIIIPIVVIFIAAAAVIFYISTDRNSDNGNLVLSGTVEAVEVNLSFKTPGKVIAVNFDESDQVSRGDTVAEMSHRESLARINQIDDQIAAAAAQLKSLKIQKETLERNLTKVTNLVSSGGATTGEQEDLQDRVRENEAAINASQNSINALKSQRDYLKIVHDDEYLVAPSDGTVIVRSVEPGEVVSLGKTIITIADLKNLEITVYIPEARLGQVKTGQTALIEIDSYPDRQFPGIISRISDKAEFTPKNIQTKDERVKTVYAAKVSAEDQGGILKPGMPCDVIIDLNR